MPNITLSCRDCRKDFVFTDSEQKAFERKGWDAPKRCPNCRAAKKLTTPSPATPAPQPSVKQAHAEGHLLSHSSSNRETRSEQVPGRIPSDYLIKGYLDEEGLLRREIFSAEARDIAAVLNARDTTPTRLRSFYNKLAAINYQLEQTGDFNLTKVKLAAFLSTVEYARARSVVPEEFLDFINRNLLLAEQSPKCFSGFLEHYKSIIAYAKSERNFTAADWIGGRGLPPGYLDAGYYDSNGYLRREVIIEWPKAIVEVFARESFSSTALRRFYNKLKGLDTKHQFNRNFKLLLPDLYAFERDAAYAAARLVVPGVFIGFAVKNVDLATRDEKGFKGFVEHFQSIVAFAKGKLKEGGNRQ
ncbi:MAG: type III-A CRISPR-associated protein Csm2 [Bacillota bacterium]